MKDEQIIRVTRLASDGRSAEALDAHNRPYVVGLSVEQSERLKGELERNLRWIKNLPWGFPAPEAVPFVLNP